MICYCHHCGAILNSENDTCPACGCRGAAFQPAHDNHRDGERERFCPFCGEEVPTTAASCRSSPWKITGRIVSISRALPFGI